MDIAYSRNRIRHELLPLLESNYNPEIRAALTRMADIASETSEFIALAAATSRSEIVRGDSLDAYSLTRIPIAMQRQIVRMEIDHAKGDLKDVSLEQVDRVLDALRGGGDFTITLPTGRVYATRRENEFTIQTKQPDTAIEPFDIVLNVPGITAIPETGYTIEAEVVVNPTACKLPPNETMVDFAAIKGALRARNLCTGDRIVPFGMSESKKLQDVFVDKKIARRDRPLSVIVEDDENVLWVAEVVSSEIGRIGPQTHRAVHLITHR
jgi:tRNA(Ile)-lysidine synthase